MWDTIDLDPPSSTHTHANVDSRKKGACMRKAGAACLPAFFLPGLLLGHTVAQTASGASKPTATPVKHLVVIFDENISFDHYFGTYPKALNPPHEPAFKALPGTPSVNGLTPTLLQRNPNFLNVTVNGDYDVNPISLGPKQAFTADQSHDYT